LPNIKSASKRVQVSAKKNLQNRMVKSALKTQIKELEKAAQNKAGNLNDLYKETVSQIDKAASKGAIHRNNASRKKAQAAKLIASV